MKYTDTFRGYRPLGLPAPVGTAPIHRAKIHDALLKLD